MAALNILALRYYIVPVTTMNTTADRPTAMCAITATVTAMRKCRLFHNVQL
jgi:hypothetical protein